MFLTPFPSFLLLSLLVKLVESQVPAPFNVTLHCHNLENILTWNYEQQNLTGLRFRVDIRSDSDLGRCPKEVWVEERPLQANLSFLTDPVAAYYVTVTAVNGKHESESTEENEVEFSYFRSSMVPQKCSVDFPLVNLTPQIHNQFKLQFTHPFLLHKHKLGGCSKKSNRRDHSLSTFTYEVTLNLTEQHHTFECETEVCEEELHVPAEDYYCLNFKGELKMMLLESTKPLCVSPKKDSPNNSVTILVVFCVICLVVIGLIIFVVLRKTQPSSTLPSFLKRFQQIQRQPVLQTADEVLSSIHPSSPTPLVEKDEPEEKTWIPKILESTSTEDIRLKLGLPQEDEEPEEESEGCVESPYTAGHSLEDEGEQEQEESRSSYERRPVLDQLAPEDRHEGYRG